MSKGKPRARRLHSPAQVIAAARIIGCRVEGDRMSCPAHGGDGLSVAIYVGDQGEARPWCFKPDCTTAGIIAALRPHLGEPDTDVGTDRVIVQRGPRQRPEAMWLLPAGHSEAVAEFAFRADLHRLLEAERGIAGAVAVKYGFQYTEHWKARDERRFVIPVKDPAGNVISFIAHALKSMRGPDRPGIDVHKGMGRWAFACLDPQVFAPGDLVIVTEGEMDALAVRSAGYAAYGAPGASSWDDAFAAELRDEYKAGRIVVIGDRDDAGQKFNAAVVESCKRAGLDARAVLLPEVVR